MGTENETESSVLMNLNDLFEMEAQRREDEVATRERARAEEAARLERERREHEEAIRRAREQERLRAQAELETRNAQIEGRIATLRAELEQVAAAREQTRLQMAEMAARTAEPTSRRGTWIAGAMAAVSLVAALTATAVAWPSVDPAPRPEPVVVVDEPTAPETPEVDVVVDEAPAVDEGALADATPVADESAPEEPDTPRVRRPRPRPQTPAGQDLGSQLTFGEGDGLIPE